MVDGFLVIDKPPGLTSHDVVNRVRRILGTKKVGHTGTLDPFATGVLPVAVGDGTKAIQFLDEGIKEYKATIRFGVSTDTLDITGAVLRQGDFSSVTEELLQQKILALTGEISQLPPMYSAIKQSGQPLYKLARKGIEVERQPRNVTIHKFELLSFKPPFADVVISCSRGTYIRTIADDLGSIFGCGACLTDLRRIASGPFRIETSMTIDSIAEAAMIQDITAGFVSVLSALSHLPVLDVDNGVAIGIRNGQMAVVHEISIELPFDDDNLRCCVTNSGRLVAVLQKLEDKIAIQRVFN